MLKKGMSWASAALWVGCTLTIVAIGTACAQREWHMGNTQVVPHPRHSQASSPSTIPAMITRVEESLRGPSSAHDYFLGPVAALPWLVRNTTHRWTELDISSAAIARLYVAMMSTDAFEDEPRMNDTIHLVSRHSWVLCFAKDPADAAGIEHLNRCTAFRSRQGHIALGVATIHEVVLERGSAQAGERIHVTIMEETMQIFHPNEIKARADFVHRLTENLIEELVIDKAESVLWSVTKAEAQLLPLLAVESAHDGLRGMSLLSYEAVPIGSRNRHTQQPDRLTPADDCSTRDDTVQCGERTPHFENHNDDTLTVGVVSQNVWNFNGNWDYRRQALSRDVALTVPFEVDVALYQEVRYHSDAPNLVLPHSLGTRGDTTNGKIQTLDVVLGLQQATNAANAATTSSDNEAEELTASSTKSGSTVAGFAFYPSMAYLHFPRFQAPRIEIEGLMNVLISSKHRPSKPRLVGHVRHLLSRTVDDEGGDDHQRAVLCSIVMFRTNKRGREVRIDFCTSHFALGEQAQNRNAIETVAFLDRLQGRKHFDAFSAPGVPLRSRGLPAATATFFVGDLNSEPHHEVAAILQEGGYVDMWMNCPPASRTSPLIAVVNAEAITDDSSEPNPVPAELAPNTEGYTFNTNDETLVKRIDFVYLKVHGAVGAQSGAVEGHCSQFALVGTTKPVSGNVSSDHLGVAAEVNFRFG